jgi:hypothetical protein
MKNMEKYKIAVTLSCRICEKPATDCICHKAALKARSESLILQEAKKSDPIMRNVDNVTFENLIKFARAVKHQETFKLMPDAPKVIIDNVNNTVNERFEIIKEYNNQIIGKAIEMLFYASIVNLTDSFVITCSLCEKYYKCQKEGDNNIMDKCNIFAHFLSETNQIRTINIKLAKKYNFSAIKIRETVLSFYS